MGHRNNHSGDQRSGRVVPYEDYDLLDVPLGDILRGERATLGKSLLDVERDLKIKASFIAAIENADLDAFSSRGFIAGYVRSYARYLGLDAEWTFERFSRESGYLGAKGINGGQVTTSKRSFSERPKRVDPNDVISAAQVSFAPERERFFDRVEPGALGSLAVLALIILGLGYGAWAILHDIQRLQFAPVDEAPVTLAELDPVTSSGGFGLTANPTGEAGALPSGDRIDRLYRPQALDAPVLTPRDEPLATLDPDRVGTLAVVPERRGLAQAEPEVVAEVQVTERPEDEVLLFAVRPTWIRVATASGAVLWEGTLNAGDTYVLPRTEEPSMLARAGNSGSLYFAVNGVALGPAGQGTEIARDVTLSADAIIRDYTFPAFGADPDLPVVAALVLGGAEDAAQ